MDITLTLQEDTTAFATYIVFGSIVLVILLNCFCSLFVKKLVPLGILAFSTVVSTNCIFALIAAVADTLAEMSNQIPLQVITYSAYIGIAAIIFQVIYFLKHLIIHVRSSRS